jgi:hypothetical protein
VNFLVDENMPRPLTAKIAFITVTIVNFRIRQNEKNPSILMRYAFISIDYPNHWRFRNFGTDHLARQFVDSVDLGDRESNSGKCSNRIGDCAALGVDWSVWILLLLVAHSGEKEEATSIDSPSFACEI